MFIKLTARDISSRLYRPLAQLGEHQTHNLKVTSSILVGSTKVIDRIMKTLTNKITQYKDGVFIPNRVPRAKSPTIEEWFTKLPADVQQKALSLTNPRRLNREEDSLIDAIYSAFDPRKSPQGEDYWINEYWKSRR